MPKLAQLVALRSFDRVLNRARQVLYRFAASALADPRGGGCCLLYDPAARQLVIDSAAILSDEPSFIAAELAPGEHPLAALDPAAILAALPASRAGLNQLYEMTFGLLTTGSHMTFETEHIPGKFTFQRSNGLADVAGFYHAFGLARIFREPERHDHLVVELEFMACIIALERLAEEGDAQSSREQGRICRDGQTRFFRAHLAWWVPAFTRLLARSAVGSYYAAVGKFLSAFMAAERVYLRVPTARVFSEPTTIKRSQRCSGCKLAV